MENMYPFFQRGDEFYGSLKLSDEQNWNLSAEDRIWSMAASKLAFEERMRTKVEHGNGNNVEYLRPSVSELNSNKVAKGKLKNKGGEEARSQAISKLMNADWKFNVVHEKPSMMGSLLTVPGQPQSAHNLDKRFKSLPQAEMLPRGETLGGYIFVCNNDTMQEDLKRQLFGLPQRYWDSVRAIQPGLPLFLYNYTTHQLHGIFEAASFGGSNIDPSAWEDKKCKGESRFPAQVRSRVRKICKPLEEDSFRPVLHHYDGPKFRLQLSIPETLALLDLFNERSSR
ncbi:hypothetical protein GOP47_0011767 [Adiantum capillus-veneris]|uniref:DCD domain-containing protein n=1 Tax=Adiantum capillus-veneris TaxID=13818 RepID=A0A9D4UTT4_ADICA|nr:hypothetical protein GOP47_0011767 [Adiantum capillus-veneris]